MLYTGLPIDSLWETAVESWRKSGRRPLLAEAGVGSMTI